VRYFRHAPETGSNVFNVRVAVGPDANEAAAAEGFASLFDESTGVSDESGTPRRDRDFLCDKGSVLYLVVMRVYNCQW